MHFQKQHAALGLNGVTCQSAVAEPRPDVPQIAFLAERIGAMRTETFPEGRPAVDHCKVHVAPPKAKQKTVSDEFDRPGGGAQRWFCPSGLSLLCSTFWGGIRMYFPSSLRLA
jgi:hypothetical protein